MAATITTTEIDRPQAQVFAYVTDPSRFCEWQAGVVGGSMEGAGTPTLGARCSQTRHIGGADRSSTSVLTKIDPPSSWAVRGISGPIRALVDVTVEPLGTSRSCTTIAVDFEGHGVGKLLVPLIVRRQTAKEMPANCRRLKERLDGTPAASS